LENCSAIETANIGREGAFGLFAAIYSRVSYRCIVQLEGRTVRCPIELLQFEFKSSEHVRNLFVSYSETLLSQVQQTVASNAMHSTEERLCRWLLMMHDRAEGESLTYTHEFLANMLGANRKSVTLAVPRRSCARRSRRPRKDNYDQYCTDSLSAWAVKVVFAGRPSYRQTPNVRLVFRPL
jgi:CRP-like cAMP-binding protein